MTKKIVLVQEHVHGLRALLDFTANAKVRDAAYQAELTRIVNSMGKSAHAAWTQWTSDELRAELKRWKNCYIVERTRQGYRTRPYLKSVGRYRKTPDQTRLTSIEADRRRLELVRC